MSDSQPDIPGFRIRRLIGKGAMAAVWLARDESLDRDVALKIMSRSLADDPSFRDRFLAEARDTAKFAHPGIVSIYSTGVHEGSYYLCLEYLPEGTLKERLNQRLQERAGENDTPFSAAEAVALLRQLGGALAYAHSKNVIHRDIKPANILFRDDGTAVVSDFGIAKSVTANRELTQTGFQVGTPSYMSPEQKLGADIDARSDLYAVGVMLYELLTGDKPHRAETGNYADLRRELEADVPRLPANASALQPVLDKLLAKDPDERFGSARELLTALDQVERGGGDDATVIQAPRTSQAPAGGRRGLVIGGGVAAVAVVALVATLLLGGGEEALPPPEPVDAQTEQQIADLLDSAATYREAQWLISPPRSNAVELLLDALELQPRNPEATAALAEVEAQLVEMIEADLDAGNVDAARERLTAANHFFPDNRNFQRLSEQVGG